jgi:hypothetical protein
MVIGNPYKFGFIIDDVPAWYDKPRINGFFIICINEQLFPNNLDNTMLTMEVEDLFNEEYRFSLKTMPINEALYRMEKNEAFMKMFDLAYPGAYFKEREDEDEDGTYITELHCLQDNKCSVFVVSDGKMVRILGVETPDAVSRGNYHYSYARPGKISEVYLTKEQLSHYLSELRTAYEQIKNKYVAMQ